MINTSVHENQNEDDDVTVLQKLGFSQDGGCIIKPEWVIQAFTTKSLSQQIDDYKDEIVKSTFHANSH